MATKLLTYAIITPASEECFTVDQMKNYLKIPSTVVGDDALVLAAIIGARQLLEKRTSNIMVNTALAEYFDEFPSGHTLELGLAPVGTWGKLEYLNESGTFTEFDAANYTTDLVSRPCRIMLKSGKSWPTDVGQFPNAIKANYSAGSADADLIPGPLRAAMSVMISAFYYKATESSAIALAFDFAESLMKPYIWKK